MTERVAIGIPVYRGQLFIEESLNSVLNQTYEDYQVIISVDGPDPECEEICSKFLCDPRIRMVVQPQRLGWRANMNWLMAQVQTEFWHHQEQDDVIDSSFLEVLVKYSRSKPAGRDGLHRHPCFRQHGFPNSPTVRTRECIYSTDDAPLRTSFCCSAIRS